MEKRNFTRVVFRSEAIVKSKDESLNGEIENLSLNGMLMKVPERLPVDEPVEVEVYLSGTSSELSMRMEGRVSRHSEEGLAVHFTGMNLDSFIHLRNIIAYNEGDEQKVMDEFYR